MRRIVIPVVAVGGVAVLLAWAGCRDESATETTGDGRPEAETPRPPQDPIPTKVTRPRERAEPPPVEQPPAPVPPAPTAGASLEPRSEGELPESELGSGDCSLRLQLVDSATGDSVESGVRLWRLGAAASAKWSAGDHVQRRVVVPATGVDVRGLPAGRYRVEVDVARAADDAPEFTLQSEASQLISVAKPRLIPVRCVVVDANGSPLSSAWRRAGPVSRATPKLRSAPAWSAPRQPLEPGAPNRGSGSDGGASSPDKSLVEITAGPAGFSVGDIQESSRVSAYTGSYRLQFADRNVVQIWADGRDAVRCEFVAVAVPLADLASHVRLPDGRSAVDAGATVTADCTAVLRQAGESSSQWRSVPVTVNVELAGYAPLQYQWRADDRPRDVVSLVAVPK